MKIKTSLIIIAGCFVIFLFIMLPIFLSVNNEKEEYLNKYKGASFSLKEVNNEIITEESFNGHLTAGFFGFTNCQDVCTMRLTSLDLVINNLENEKKNKCKVF